MLRAIRKTPRSDILIPKAPRIDGNVSVRELKIIAGIVKKRQPKRVLEIGTFNGRTTLTIAMNAPNAKVWTVDIPHSAIRTLRKPIVRRLHGYDDVRYINKDHIGAMFKGTVHKKNIMQVFSDSADLNRHFAKRTFDLIFIDGSHSYEYTKSDSDFAFRHLSKTGIILWHDYGKRCWPGVKRAIDECAHKKKLSRIVGTSIVSFGNL